MKIIRWFKINIPEAKKALLAELLLEQPYSDEFGEGFSINNISKNEISGSYIQSKTFIKEIISPIGTTESLTAIDYTKIDFRIKLNHPSLLEIYSKQRTLKPFVNALSNIIGFGFTIADININLNEFISTLEDDLGKLKIIKVVVSDINIQNKALGELTLTSEQELREVIDNHITIGKKYNVKYIKAIVLDDVFYNGSFELYRNSKLSISNLPPLFFDHFLKSFLKIL